MIGDVDIVDVDDVDFDIDFYIDGNCGVNGSDSGVDGNGDWQCSER